MNEERAERESYTERNVSKLLDQFIDAQFEAAKAQQRAAIQDKPPVTTGALVLENDRQEPHPSTLRKLSEALGIEASKLIEGRPL
jgi:hypothetical protein